MMVMVWNNGALDQMEIKSPGGISFPLKLPNYGDKNTPWLIPEAEAVDSTVLPVFQQPVIDRLLNNQVYLPQGESMQVAKVVRRACL